MSATGMIQSGDQTQQARFADAIAPNQAAALLIESQIQGTEQRFAVSELADQVM